MMLRATAASRRLPLNMQVRFKAAPAAAAAPAAGAAGAAKGKGGKAAAPPPPPVAPKLTPAQAAAALAVKNKAAAAKKIDPALRKRAIHNVVNRIATRATPGKGPLPTKAQKVSLSSRFIHVTCFFPCCSTCNLCRRTWRLH